MAQCHGQHLVARQSAGRQAKAVAGIASTPDREGAPKAARARTTVHDPTDPSFMSPEARVSELAALLAAGVLRLRLPRIQAPESGPGQACVAGSKSGESGLDDRAETRLDGPRG